MVKFLFDEFVEFCGLNAPDKTSSVADSRKASFQVKFL